MTEEEKEEYHKDFTVKMVSTIDQVVKESLVKNDLKFCFNE